MQYIAGNTTPIRFYHGVPLNAPLPEDGGGISGMLLDIRALLDNMVQQNCPWLASIGSSTASSLT